MSASALAVQALIRPAGRLAILSAFARLHLGELMVARFLARPAAVVIPRIVAGELYLFVDGGLVGLEIDVDLTALQLGADLLQSRSEDSMVENSKPHPACEICEEPAAMLHDEGVCLCAAHSQDCLQVDVDADAVRWDLTPAAEERLVEAAA